MFKPDRIFSIKNHQTGVPEWYFQAREGSVGPYETKEQVACMLKKFIKSCIELGHTGGRKQGNKHVLAELHV